MHYFKEFFKGQQEPPQLCVFLPFMSKYVKINASRWVKKRPLREDLSVRHYVFCC